MKEESYPQLGQHLKDGAVIYFAKEAFALIKEKKLLHLSLEDKDILESLSRAKKDLSVPEKYPKDIVFRVKIYFSKEENDFAMEILKYPGLKYKRNSIYGCLYTYAIAKDIYG